MSKNKLIKSRERVKEHAEVYTAEREVKAMCDLIPSKIWENIESTFLEPACGNGNILAEILERKLNICKNERDGLKALNSLFGIDIQEDNVIETRERMISLYKLHFPNANDFAIELGKQILRERIVCDDMLNPQTETVKSWGVTPCDEYVKYMRKRRIKNE